MSDNRALTKPLKALRRVSIAVPGIESGGAARLTALADAGGEGALYTLGQIMLELRLLGTPVIHLNGAAVRVKTRKGLALTALLALEGESARDRLAALFWADAADAKNSLRNALSSLRESFAEALIVTRNSVRLEVDACDALAVLRGDAPAALGYAGALLDGLSLPEAPEAEDWLEAARGRVLVAAIRSLERLDGPEALEKLCELDGLNEAAHRRLIEMLIAEGNRAAALRVFERFSARLETELGVAPTPQTLALAESLRRSGATPEAPPRPRAGRVPSLPSLLLESRLVGRVNEFQRLVADFHAAAERSPRVTLLSGEPGIGKTRLAQEFVAWAAARGSSVLQSRAFEGGALAFQSISDALRGVTTLEALLSKVWLAELSRLLPELMETHPDLPAPVEDEALGRSRVFEAVSRVVGGLARRAAEQGGTLVWLLDDAQWMDAASLELLAFVARRVAFDALPVLIVLTARTEGLADLQPWLAGLSRELPVVRLEVTALSKADTARLLEGLGLPLEPLLERLYAETGGQPLFLAETLRSLAETGALSAAPDGWRVNLVAGSGMAPGVRSVIEARYSRLSPSARALLEAGAVLGQGFVFEDACRVAGLDDALEGLETLLRVRVLLELPASGFEPLRYAFSHDRLRETALEGLSKPRAERLHRRAMTRQHGSAAQRAAHAAQARDWASAARFDLMAARASMASYAWRDALAHLEQVRSMIWARPEGLRLGLGLGAEDITRLYDDLTHLRLTLNDVSDGFYLRLSEELFELAQALGDPRLEVQAMMIRDEALPFDEARGRKTLDEAETKLRAVHDEIGLFALDMRRLTFMRLQPETMRAAIAHLEGLLPRATALGREQLAWAVGNLADLLQSSGNWAAAVQYWRQELDLRGAQMNDHTAFSLENLGFSLTNSGELLEAIRCLREAYRIKREIDDNPTWIGMAGAYLSYALIEAGLEAEAREFTEGAWAMRERAIARFAAEYIFAHANVRLEREPGAARAVLEEWYPSFHERAAVSGFDEAFWVPAFSEYFESHLCSAHARLGDWSGATRHALNALGWREAKQNWRGLHAPRLHHWLEVEALRRGAELQAAERLVAGLEANVNPEEPLAVNLALARHALRGDSLKGALELARRRGWRQRVAWLEAARQPYPVAKQLR